MNRRSFIKGACLGTTGFFFKGATLRAQAASDRRPPTPPVLVHGAPLEKPSPLGMPGLFPGRVAEVFDPNSIAANRVSQPVIRRMLDAGMKQLLHLAESTLS